MSAGGGEASPSGAGAGRFSIAKAQLVLNQRAQVLLDRITPAAYRPGRWGAWALLALCYTARVWVLRGFYLVTYALAIYNLNLVLAFLTPVVVDEPGGGGLDDDGVDDESGGPLLPVDGGAEFKPFVRRLPEFKLWLSSFRSILLGMFCTFFPPLDVPVFWPILLLYWCILFVVTMKRQIRHMIKYRYVPFTRGKKTYSKAGPEAAPAKDAD